KAQTHKFSFVGSWNEEKAREITTDICKGWTFNDIQEDYTINKSLSFQKDGIQKRFVQISRNGESCHFCPGLIGAIIFSERNGRWKVEFEDKTFAKYGSHGVPPEAKLIKIGSDRHGLLFQWWRNVQGGGAYVHYVALIDLGDKRYKLILGEELYQKEVAPKPVAPKVESVSTVKSDFYDIKINTKIYHFKEGKYKVFNKEVGNGNI
ncbi:MAG: hypothetical protein PVJ45_08400, partial [Desulfobacterales bacterium]